MEIYDIWVAFIEYWDVTHYMHRRFFFNHRALSGVVGVLYFAVPAFGVLVCLFSAFVSRMRKREQIELSELSAYHSEGDGLTHRIHFGLLFLGFYSVLMWGFVFFFSLAATSIINSEIHLRRFSSADILIAYFYAFPGLLVMIYAFCYQCGRWIQRRPRFWSTSTPIHLAAFAAIYPCWHRGCIWMLQKAWAYEEVLITAV